MVDTVARIVMAVYGIAMLAGGIGGYAKAHSAKSLVAGIVSAILLAVACVVYPNDRRLSVGIGTIVALALVGVFLIRIQELLSQTPPGKIGGNIGLCALSACVATFLIYAFRQRREPLSPQISQ